MNIKKIHAKQLHNGHQFMPANSVLIINSNLVEAIVPLDAAGDDVQYIDGIVCPGFVNAHCHLELSFLHNQIPQQVGMVNFLQAVIQAKNVEPEQVQEAISNAAQQMIANGIVAVGDICNTTNTILEKTKQQLHFTNFIEISGFVPQTAAQRLEQGIAVQQQFLQKNLNATIVPHAPYSVSEQLMQAIFNHNTSHVSLHYLESEAEVNFLQNATGDFQQLFKSINVAIDFFKGYSTIVNYNNNLPKFDQLLFVHTTQLDQAIITNITTNFTNPSFCICPNANLYIGNKLPPLDLMAANNLNICIGTDSLASNWSLDIKAEIKTIQQHYPNIKLETILKWATFNGAKALNITNQYGSFEVGKIGKIVII